MTNLTPARFQSFKDLKQYMRGLFDVIYSLDYLEAEAVLQQENGYAEGLVPYLSNQHGEHLERREELGKMADSDLIAEITSQSYPNAKVFRKAMFQRRIDKLSLLKPITIHGRDHSQGLGYFHGERRRIENVEKMRQWMREAVSYDALNQYYTLQTFGHDKARSKVYGLKAAILNAYLRETADFTQSIYREEP